MINKKATKEYKVHSLERGFDLLEILAQNGFEKSLTEISSDAGFSQATTHRILSAMKSRGYVHQNPSNSKYRLTLKTFEVGSQVIQHLNLHEIALPILRDVASKTGESVFLVILEGDEALCIENINAYRNIQILFLRVGRRMPLHIGAAPKVILAHLSEKRVDEIIKNKAIETWTKKTITNPVDLKNELKRIRDQGYALSLGDVTEGAAAVGCPIINFAGEIVAAISISGIERHFTKKNLPAIIRILKNAAFKISRELHAPIEDPKVQKLRV